MHHAREVLQQLQAQLEELSWAAQNATGVDRVDWREFGEAIDCGSR